jgi:U5 small nuclear ribonucleoprotein component
VLGQDDYDEFGNFIGQLSDSEDEGFVGRVEDVEEPAPLEGLEEPEPLEGMDVDEGASPDVLASIGSVM